jgi:hypothetical protein
MKTGLMPADTLAIRCLQAGTEGVGQMLDGHLLDDVQLCLFLTAIERASLALPSRALFEPRRARSPALK